MRNTIMGKQISAPILIRMLLVMLIGMIMLTGCGVTNRILGSLDADNLGRKYNITLIAKKSEGIFWSNVFLGASAASTEYNINLTLKGPDNEEDYVTQNEMIHQAVLDGSDAIVISAIDFIANAVAVDQAAAAGVHIVVIDSDVNSDLVGSRVGTDNFEAGRVAGQAVLDVEAQQLNIGLVNFNVITENGQSRERGFRSVVGEDPRVRIIDTINVNSTVDSAKEGAIQMLSRNPEINVIVTFNEWTSLGVGNAIYKLGLGQDVHVVAFDSNVHSIDMLERGDIDALVIQTPFVMGYLGVERAYHLIRGQEVDAYTYTPVKLVTRENLFDEDYMRMIFVFD